MTSATEMWEPHSSEEGDRERSQGEDNENKFFEEALAPYSWSSSSPFQSTLSRSNAQSNTSEDGHDQFAGLGDPQSYDPISQITEDVFVAPSLGNGANHDMSFARDLLHPFIQHAGRHGGAAVYSVDTHVERRQDHDPQQDLKRAVVEVLGVNVGTSDVGEYPSETTMSLAPTELWSHSTSETQEHPRQEDMPGMTNQAIYFPASPAQQYDTQPNGAFDVFPEISTLLPHHRVCEADQAASVDAFGDDIDNLLEQGQITMYQMPTNPFEHRPVFPRVGYPIIGRYRTSMTPSTNTQASTINSLRCGEETADGTECNACFRGKFAKGNRRRHIDSKHKNNVFLCRVVGCGKSFTRLGYLRKHSDKPHRETGIRQDRSVKPSRWPSS